MNFKRMTDLDLAGKRVLIREDLNVPVKDGKVTSDARIRASLPTIEHALKAGAKVMLMSHLGRRVCRRQPPGAQHRLPVRPRRGGRAAERADGEARYTARLRRADRPRRELRHAHSLHNGRRP